MFLMSNNLRMISIVEMAHFQFADREIDISVSNTSANGWPVKGIQLPVLILKRVYDG